ncbi:MAG: hypothetical protein ACI3XA_10240 [Clostridia bacterium]
MDKNQSIKEFQNNQKHIGSNYYSFANECENPNLRIDFLAFAREESDIITWLNYELDEGEVPPKNYAPELQVKEAYTKYSQ